MNAVGPSFQYFMDLPKDLICEVASFLKPADVRSLGATSKRVRELLADHSLFANQLREMGVYRAIVSRKYTIVAKQDCYSIMDYSYMDILDYWSNYSIYIQFSNKFLLIDLKKKLYAWSSRSDDIDSLSGPEKDTVKPLPFDVREEGNVQKFGSLLLVIQRGELSFWDPFRMSLVATYSGFDRVVSAVIHGRQNKYSTLYIHLACQNGMDYAYKTHNLRGFVLKFDPESSSEHLSDRICDWNISKHAYRVCLRTGLEIANFAKSQFKMIKEHTHHTFTHLLTAPISQTLTALIQYPTLFAWPTLRNLYNRIHFYRTIEGNLRYLEKGESDSES